MSNHQLDLTPRRVWLGLTIPGKKTMRMLEPGGNVDSTIMVARRNGGLPLPRDFARRPLRQKAEKTRGQKLIHMYQGDPWMALHFAALALHAVPAQGARFGPASRDFFKPLRPPMNLYGTILTDVRDFLKLRFRTKGRVTPDEKVPPYIRWALDNGVIDPVTQTDDPRYVFGYIVDRVISDLDDRSKSPNTVEEDGILRLRDVLRGMVGLVYPYQSDAGTLDEMFDDGTYALHGQSSKQGG